jgi:DNA-3-methyladenine glycosylase I
MRNSEILTTCPWPADNPLMIAYHDTEWGVPVHDDRKHFEFFVLDLFQAGLSWSTILNKRENFRKAFDNFEPKKIARYNQRKVRMLLSDAGIIRNAMKIGATMKNARAFLAVQEEFGTFDKYIWPFVDGTPRVNKWRTIKQIPAKTAESDAMSKDLKARGFAFVGSTICYSYMQAAGMVNDHLVSCFRYRQLKKMT